MTLEEQILLGMRKEFVKFHFVQYQLFNEFGDADYGIEELKQRRENAFGAFSAMYSYCCTDLEDFPKYREFFNQKARGGLIHNGSMDVMAEIGDNYHAYRIKIGGIAMSAHVQPEYRDLKQMIDNIDMLYMLERGRGE